MILLIDNYDSFTYNLAQLAGSAVEINIIRNDDSRLMEIAEEAEGIIVSPGPGTPEETGQTIPIIQKFYKKKPILGICLGHQAIGYAFGETVRRATHIYHGKSSMISQNEGSLFKGLPKQFKVIRYHSLVIDQKLVSEEFKVTAYSDEDQEIMGIEHKEYPLFGIQFHPESIGTKDGSTMLQNFIQLCGGK